MNNLEFSCKYCNQVFDYNVEMIGLTLNCPSCNNIIEVPNFNNNISKTLKVEQPQIKTKDGRDTNIEYKLTTEESDKKTNPLGIASLVLGIISSLFCWIPFLGILSIPVASIGLIIGFIGLIISLINKKSSISFQIAGLIICFISIFLAINSTKFVTDSLAEAREKTKNIVEKSSTTVNTNMEEKNKEEQLTTLVATEATQKNENKWQSAKDFIAYKGLILKIDSLKVDFVKAVSAYDKKSTSLSSEKFLIIKIEITNKNQNKKINYKSWYNNTFEYGKYITSLVDNFDNTYKKISFNISSKPDGVIESESIYPNKTIYDTIFFEIPIDGFDKLYLTLPAKNLELDGELNIEIPKSMIQFK